MCYTYVYFMQGYIHMHVGIGRSDIPRHRMTSYPTEDL